MLFLQEISSKPEFLTSHNDQSLVEICVTRVISAVRETGSIQQHAESLISLLKSCLSHSLRPTGRGDPPHAKMASDIMSCVFLNYNKKPVMQLAIPVAVKFLHKGNKELSRNMSSYMSLAAIENADILATYLQPILDSVISGNYSLSRVLPAIFAVDKQLIKNHVMTLVSILPNCAGTENMALLTLFGQIAKDSPALLEPSIPQLCEGLSQQSTAGPTLQVLKDVATAKPKCLVDHMAAFKQTAKNFPKSIVSVVQLLSVVARTSVDKSRETLDYVFDVFGSVECEQHSLVLKEVSNIAQKFPSLLNSAFINRLSELEDSANNAAKTVIYEIKNEYNMQRIDRLQEKNEKIKIVEGSYKSIVKVGGSKTDMSNSSKEIHTRSVESDHPLKSSSHALSGSGGARVELTAVTKHEAAPGLNATLSIKKDGSRSTGKLPTHRSMTRLNLQTSAGRLESRLGLHKSMTRLDHRYNSSGAVAPAPLTVTNIPVVGGSSAMGRSGSCRPPALSTYTAKQSGVTVTTAPPNSASPTKSMSSGSMAERERDLAGREILTVNKLFINQIHSEFARQSHQLSSVSILLCVNFRLFNASLSRCSRGRCRRTAETRPCRQSRFRSLTPPPPPRSRCPRTPLGGRRPTAAARSPLGSSLRACPARSRHPPSQPLSPTLTPSR